MLGAADHLTYMLMHHELTAGIISCLTYNPDLSGMLAAGAYSGVAALYDAGTLAPTALLPGGHSAGITQVHARVSYAFVTIACHAVTLL